MLILSSASVSSLLASSLRNSIPTQVDRLVSALELQPVGVDEMELPGGARARIRSFENSDSRVAWAAAVEIDGAGDQFAGSLSVWLAPSVDVPHLQISLDSGDELALEVDFIPRLDAAFDAPRDASGEYAAPTSREEFACASRRTAYDAAFFTPEAREWCERVRAAGTASTKESLAIEGRRQYASEGNYNVISGPLLVDVTLPADDAGAATAAAAVEDAVGRWLGWLDEAEPATWMDTRLIFARDSQVRRQLAVAERAALEERHGDAGAEVAIAACGKLDMEGHNMMQEQGAFGTDDPDEGRD